MARIVIGKVCKGKPVNENDPDGPKKADYIKFDQDVSFVKGDFVNLESKASRQKSLLEAIAIGKISGEGAEKAQAVIDKMPDWIRFELVVYKK